MGQFHWYTVPNKGKGTGEMEQIDFDMTALAGELTEDERAELSRFIDRLIEQRESCYNGTKVRNE